MQSMGLQKVRLDLATEHTRKFLGGFLLLLIFFQESGLFVCFLPAFENI